MLYTVHINCKMMIYMKFMVHEESRGKYLAQVLYDIKKQRLLILKCIFDLRFRHTIESWGLFWFIMYIYVVALSVIYVNSRYIFISIRFQ